MIDQQYSIAFITTPRSSETTVQKRSGNPGYISGFPVKAGFNDTVNAGAKIVYEDGLKISGADNYGKCMAQA
jgi:hypothetical protein